MIHSMPMLRNLIVLILCAILPACGEPASNHARMIKSLIEPAKLATLGDRGANPRTQKITAILWKAKQAGEDPAKVAAQAVDLIGWGGTTKGSLTAEAIVRNLTIAERLGSVTPEDIEAMSRGRAATVRKGPYAGEILSVDHIIPRAVAPELDNVIANLELMPLSVNQRKGNKVTSRQADLARKLNAARLFSEEGLKRVLAVQQ
jgi:hypothetical protein